jgi:hypothetical protein
MRRGALPTPKLARRFGHPDKVKTDQNSGIRARLAGIGGSMKRKAIAVGAVLATAGTAMADPVAEPDATSLATSLKDKVNAHGTAFLVVVGALIAVYLLFKMAKSSTR